MNKGFMNRLTQGRIYRDGEDSSKLGSFTKKGDYLIHDSIMGFPWNIFVKLPFRGLKNFSGSMLGISGCLRCGDNWCWKKHHTIQYSKYAGAFPLCEECWTTTTLKEKEYYTRMLVDEWIRQNPLDLWKYLGKLQQMLNVIHGNGLGR